MGYGTNHYNYANIIDPNRPRPVKPPSKVPPRMTDAQKAEALARILAVKSEIESREADAVARVAEARDKVLKAANEVSPEVVPDLAEAKKVLRDAQVRAARTKYQDKIKAETDAARDALLKLQAKTDQKKFERLRRNAKDEAQLVADYRAGMPTARDLMNEAQIAEMIERVERRKAKKREKDRLAEVKRRERRRKEKADRLTAEAAEVEAKLRALIVTSEQVVAFQAYMTRSQSCRDRYFQMVGRTMSEEEETLRDRAVKLRLLKRLEADPRFLDAWRVSRWIGPIDTLPPDEQEKRRSSEKRKREMRKDRQVTEFLAERPRVEGVIAALSEDPRKKWAIDQLVKKSIRYGQRWRQQTNLEPWNEVELELAALRAKTRILERVGVEPDYLEQWHDKERARRADTIKRKMDRIKADPDRLEKYRESVSTHRTEWRARKRAEKAAEAPTTPQVKLAKLPKTSKPIGVTPVAEGETADELFAKLMRIFQKARRDAARREK